MGLCTKPCWHMFGCSCGVRMRDLLSVLCSGSGCWAGLSSFSVFTMCPFFPELHREFIHVIVAELDAVLSPRWNISFNGKTARLERSINGTCPRVVMSAGCSAFRKESTQQRPKVEEHFFFDEKKSKGSNATLLQGVHPWLCVSVRVMFFRGRRCKPA